MDNTSNTFILDGERIPYKAGESVYNAAERAGKKLPSLCWDKRLDGGAHCRLCVVKVKGGRLPVASCTLKATENLEITAYDDDLNKNRKTLMEMVLSENPQGDCPRCRTTHQQTTGICELHSLAEALTAESGKFRGAISQEMKDDSNPFIIRDYSRCISCYRCTRICDEIEADFAITPAGRGFNTFISTANNGSLLDSSCTFCGQCIQTCPTGALTDKKLSDRINPETGPVTTAQSVCTYCGTGCSIDLHAQEGKLIGVTPNMDGPANEGALCVKGQFAFDFVNSGDRLKQPYIRKKGTLVPSSWDEAYDLVAERMLDIRKTHGPESIYAIASGRTSTESNYIMQKWMRTVIGTHNVDNCSRG